MDMTQAAFRRVKTQTVDKPDLKTASKQVEELFMNELLRTMLEQTSIGQDRTVSTFLPAITSELAKSMAERGIGLGDFLLKGNGSLKTTDEESVGLVSKNKVMHRTGATG
jgi:Rod binding domain-containing protein